MVKTMVNSGSLVKSKDLVLVGGACWGLLSPNLNGW